MEHFVVAQNTRSSKFSIIYYDPAYVDMWPLSRLPETNPKQPHTAPQTTLPNLSLLSTGGRLLILHAFELEYIGSLFR